jgi:hypothetical protein
MTDHPPIAEDKPQEPAALDTERAGRLLSLVLDLAESLPTRRREALAYPPFARRVRQANAASPEIERPHESAS